MISQADITQSYPRQHRPATSNSQHRPVTSNGHFDVWALAHLNESIMFESSIPQMRALPAGARDRHPRSRFTALVCGVKDAIAMRSWVDAFIEAGYGVITLLQVMTVRACA